MKKLIFLFIFFIHFNYAFANELVVKAKYNGDIYSIENTQDEYRIVIKNTHEMVSLFNGTGFDVFGMKSSDYIVHLEFIEEIKSDSNLASLDSVYGNAEHYYQIDVSRKDALYDIKSGAIYYSSDGGTGFEVTRGENTTIVIPKYLINTNNPIMRVTLEDVGLQKSYGLKNNASKFKTFVSPYIFPDMSGEAQRQDVLTRIDSATPVVVSGVISTSVDLRAFNADGTVFFDANNWAAHGGFSAGPSNSKSKNVFSGFTGLAYHSGNFDVFEKLGATYQASHFGVSFTVNDAHEISSDGFILFFSPNSEFSASGGISKDLSSYIKTAYFGLNNQDMNMLKTLYWMHVLINMNKTLDALSQKIDQVMSELDLETDSNTNVDDGGLPDDLPGDGPGDGHNWRHGTGGRGSCTLCHERKGTVEIGPITITPA